jgi:hypothetical protein
MGLQLIFRHSCDLMDPTKFCPFFTTSSDLMDPNQDFPLSKRPIGSIKTHEVYKGFHSFRLSKPHVFWWTHYSTKTLCVLVDPKTSRFLWTLPLLKPHVFWWTHLCSPPLRKPGVFWWTQKPHVFWWTLYLMWFDGPEIHVAHNIRIL